MSIISNETFLPGVVTEVESDYSFGYDASQFGTTDAELIIGTAFNGPVGTPVPVYSPEHARYIFGGAYDSKTKREASLVAGVEDAYARGCRTIYAIRITGKEIFKDFDFRVDTSLKLRVAGLHPSNEAKDFFMVYDDTPGDEKIKIYKPAKKATIAEKMQGLVENDNAVLVTEMRISRDYGMTRESKLIDLLRIFNEHVYNNTLRLYIVDENGSDVTNSSVDAQDIPIGSIFPGAYMLGRDKSFCTSITNVRHTLIDDDSLKPYPSFEDVIYKTLEINTDINAPLPIYAENMDVLRAILREVEIFTSKPFDFLETQGVVDRAFRKDSVDHEEVSVSDFEIYKRLGSGFAITARAERRVDSNGIELAPRIRETPVTDSNRVAVINDGIYSILENLGTKYRVLTCANADTQITGKLPRAEDYIVSAPESLDIMNGLIRVTPKVRPDKKTSAKSYKFKVEKLTDTSASSVEDIYTDKIIHVIAGVASEADLVGTTVSRGTLVMTVDSGKGTLKRFNDGRYEILNSKALIGDLYIVKDKIYVGVDEPGGVVFTEAAIDTTGADPLFEGKKFILAENNGKVYALKIVNEPDKHVRPLGNIRTMLSENKEKTLVYAQSNYYDENPITIRSAILDAITLEEFVEMLNEHDSLKGLFHFDIVPNEMDKKDDYVADLVTTFTSTYKLSADRTMSYDYSRYIPYKTNDNFARQLAQHCTYTSLKTAPTHGFIGCTKIADLSLNSIASRVNEILGVEFDLYAKNPQGRNMLDRNNMPYPIGKNISIVFGQYQVNMDDGYRHTSNGAAGYAGMVSQLPLDQSSTAQPIKLPDVAYNLTNYQLTRLTQKGLITFRQSYTRGIVVTDGITMAPAASPFRRLSATRIIGAVEELIREAVEPYIGKQNHAANRNSMQTAIKSRLDKLVGRLIEEYDFNMIVDPRVMKFSYIDIDYKIVPVYEIREVRNRISVKDEL